MILLFRYPPQSHAFITPEDPSYRYEVLCGHCGYPIDRSDPKCPRCQRELEDCPVCSMDRHTKSPKVSPDAKTGGKTCPVCRIMRIPFGERRVSEIAGSFCTNLYGCPAGGFLLKTEEFAVLPVGATLCPICGQEEFPPADVRTFTHLLNICWFCNTCFGSPDHWRKDWAEVWNPNLERVREASRTKDDPPCRLCGRNDQKVEEAKATEGRMAGNAKEENEVPLAREHLKLQSFLIGPEGQEETCELDEAVYLRVAELGRILIMERDDSAAFGRAFDAWFQPVFKHAGIVTVEEVARHILEGTLCPPQYRILQKRLALFVQAWEQKLPSGLHHRIPEAEGRRRETHC